jgi:hypothetical protein
MQDALDDKRLRSKLPYTMFKSRNISNQYDYQAEMSEVMKAKGTNGTQQAAQQVEQQAADTNSTTKIYHFDKLKAMLEGGI